MKRVDDPKDDQLKKDTPLHKVFGPFLQADDSVSGDIHQRAA